MKHHHRPAAVATITRLQEQAKATLQPPKFCKDCHWHDFEQVERRDRLVYRHYCKFPPLLDLITGQPGNPAKNRNDATACGKDASHFTAKQKATP